MDEPWRALFHRLRATGFAQITGAEAALVLPVADGLVTELVHSAVPAVRRLREFEIRAQPGNVLSVWVRLTQPALLPGIRVRLHIESQPQLPSSPVLTMRVISRGLAALTRPVAALLGGLPRGVSLHGDRLSINLSTLLDRYGAAEALSFLTVAELTTVEGRVIVTLRATAPPAQRARNTASGQ
jgi:hypothetical protein